jgi:hypothetical protein
MIQSIRVAFATFIALGQLALTSAAAIPNADLGIRTIALSNDLAPGTNGRRFQSFNQPVINDFGNVAFPAQLQCCIPTGTVYSMGRGSLELVGINNSPAEPGGNITFDSLGDIQLDNHGRSIVTAQLNNAPPEFKGIFAGQSNQNLMRIVVAGQSIVPSDPTAVYFGLGSPAVSGSGNVAGVAVSKINSHVANGSDVLWKSDGTSLAQPVMREGAQLNFHPSGVVVGTYYHSAFELPVVSDSGEIALRASIVDKRGASLEPYGDDLLLIEPDGSYSKVAEDSVASSPYGELSFPVLNDHGAVAFAGGHANTGTIYRKLPGQAAEPIVVRGSAAPGMPGVTFDSLFIDFNSISPLWISNRGDVAFWASLVGAPLGPNFAESVWSGSPGNVHPVIVERQPAPGTGGVFSSMPNVIGDLVLDMAVNNNSQVVVWCYWQAGSGDLRSGIFATDMNGKLQKIVADGDFIEVSPGVFRQVVNLSFQGDKELRRQTGLNDLGQVAFQASFSDGTSGLFVSSLVAVPEPAAATLFIFACAISYIDRRISRHHSRRKV